MLTILQSPFQFVQLFIYIAFEPGNQFAFFRGRGGGGGGGDFKRIRIPLGSALALDCSTN